MLLFKPSKEEVFNFIAETHRHDRIPVTLGDVALTYEGKATSPNPFVDGHLKAFSYLFNLIDKDHFPARDPKNISSLYKSSQALSWLKELHIIITLPIANNPLLLEQESEHRIPRTHCGTYRLTQDPFAPQPDMIPKILHNWLVDTLKFHEQIKDKCKTAYGLTKSQAEEMKNRAYEANVLISCLQPFHTANNRIGRLLEALLRLQWRLRFKTVDADTQQKFIKDVSEYQENRLQEIIQKAKQVR